VVLIDSVARQRCLDKASIIWYTLWKIIVSNWCFLTLIAEADELIGDNGNDELNGDEEDMVDVGDEERGGEQEEQAKEDKDLVENVQKTKRPVNPVSLEGTASMTAAEVSQSFVLIST
jgi:hypothetical protein